MLPEYSVDLEPPTRFDVHPFANRLPMLASDELHDLADDIRANGLRHPIVLDASGVLIDGRNRLEACRLAGVAPSFTTFAGDPVAFILSANVSRRHLTAGQRAMVVVVAESFATKESWGRQVAVAQEVGVSESRISKAKRVRDHAPDLVDAVLDGSQSLDSAYAEARKLSVVRQFDAVWDGWKRQIGALPYVEAITDTGLTIKPDAPPDALLVVRRLVGQAHAAVQRAMVDHAAIGKKQGWSLDTEGIDSDDC